MKSISFVRDYYAPGDHVLITQYGSLYCSLVNLDVSGRYYFKYSKFGSNMYPDKEPRTIAVYLLSME
jgi:hypothetical protein